MVALHNGARVGVGVGMDIDLKITMRLDRRSRILHNLWHLEPPVPRAHLIHPGLDTKQTLGLVALCAFLLTVAIVQKRPDFVQALGLGLGFDRAFEWLEAEVAAQLAFFLALAETFVYLGVFGVCWAMGVDGCDVAVLDFVSVTVLNSSGRVLGA